MDNTKIMFVSSKGGHLEQIRNLYKNSISDELTFHLVTESNIKCPKWFMGDISFIFPHGGKLFYLYLFFNFIHAFILLVKVRPHILISTGSHTAIPFYILGKLFKIKRVFILSYSRINTKSKSASLIYHFCEIFIVQWESAKQNYPRSIYLDSTLYI